MNNTIIAQLHFDGACRGNPGQGGWGANLQVLNPQNSEQVDHAFYLKGALGDLTTNNIAEYSGLIGGLRKLVKFTQQSREYCANRVFVWIFGDSQLVVNQVNGDYRVTDEDLKYYHAIVRGLLQKFQGYSCHHIGRNQNQDVDALARQAAADNRRSLEHDQFVLFRPNLGAVGKAQFGNSNPIAASNDLLSAGSSSVFLIDAKFYAHKYGLEAIKNLRDPHPLQICTGKLSLNILGVVPESLTIRLWVIYHDGVSHEIEANNVIVIHKFPVPFHFTCYAPETSGIVQAFQLGGYPRFQADTFDLPYRSHPYWSRNVIILPV